MLNKNSIYSIKKHFLILNIMFRGGATPDREGYPYRYYLYYISPWRRIILPHPPTPLVSTKLSYIVLAAAESLELC